MFVMNVKSSFLTWVFENEIEPVRTERLVEKSALIDPFARMSDGILMPDLLALVLECLPGDEWVECSGSGRFAGTHDQWLNVVKRVSNRTRVTRPEHSHLYEGVRHVNFGANLGGGVRLRMKISFTFERPSSSNSMDGRTSPMPASVTSRMCIPSTSACAT